MSIKPFSVSVGEIESEVGAQLWGPTHTVLMFGWRELTVVDPSPVWRKVIEIDLPQSYSLGVLGRTGLTAWAGVHRVLWPRPGGTLVVYSAAGAVGSVVGQLRCRTVGIAGGPEKAARCTEEFGYDVEPDYRADDFIDQLSAATPDGVDAYFDNTFKNARSAVGSRPNELRGPKRDTPTHPARDDD